MLTRKKNIQFQSVLSSVMDRFIQEKRACGYKYETTPKVLKSFDNFLCKHALKQIELPKELVLQWSEKKPHEQTSTHQGRIGLIRQFAKMMIGMGYSAYVLPKCFGARSLYTFSPYIFTHKEIQNIFYAVDCIKPSAFSPIRHLIMPEMFRLLYGCGFRLNEVLNLRVKDVDFKQGIITVREGKFGKDRLVPPSLDLVERLKIYTKKLEQSNLEKCTDSSFFFPSHIHTPWSHSAVYTLFRKLLYQCGIPHGGRGKGPRVHDLRHTFAVHRLVQWYEEGADLNAKLPFLVAYLGHKDFTGTQKYLQLTAELFPNLIDRMSKQFGGVIPAWR